MPDEAKLLDILAPDDCCNRRLSKVLGKGYTLPTWVCPVCSVEWRAERKTADDGTPYRKWAPHDPVAVFRL